MDFLRTELSELFVSFGDRALAGCTVCTCFLPVHRLSFHLCTVSIAVQKLLSLIRSHLFFLMVEYGLLSWALV